MRCLERRWETGIEIEDFFRDLSPLIHRSMGEWPVIHSLGKERILAGPVEQCQVKKGRGHPYSSPLVQSRSDARSPQSSVRPPCGTSSTTSEPQVLEHSGFSLMRVRCQFFLHCLLVELSEMFWKAIVCCYFIISLPLGGFSLDRSRADATIKGLNLKFHSALLVSDRWAKLLRPVGDLTRGKPTRARGNSETWRKCGNAKMGLWEKDLRGARGPLGGQNIVRGHSLLSMATDKLP